MNPIAEADLHAYVDGQLPAGRQAQVAAWLAAHPEDAARVEAWRAQNLLLHQRFDAVLEEPLPESLKRLAIGPAAVDGKKSQKWLPAWSLQRLAAGIAIATLAGVAGWFGHAALQPTDTLARAVPLPRQAAVAHVVYSPDLRRPVEVGAEQEEQLVKWLSKRLGVPVRVPKLGARGFELVGGRLLPGNAGPVAQFMYQDAGGQRLTLYVSTEMTQNGETGFRFAREGQINVFYWVDGRFGYALSSSLGKDVLAQVATAVYDQLDNR